MNHEGFCRRWIVYGSTGNSSSGDCRFIGGDGGNNSRGDGDSGVRMMVAVVSGDGDSEGDINGGGGRG